MDSRLRYLAILGSMGLVVFVLILVLLSSGEERNVPRPSVLNSKEEIRPTEPEKEVLAGQIGDNLSAFLQDETFFDREPDSVLEEALDRRNLLDIVTTSVEKDLRVQVLNYNGELAKGETFRLTLTSANGKTEELKDLDQDGIIYAGTLKSGIYEVQLKPLEGYKVPVSPTRVEVKDKVEYIPIEDISILLKTEAEINPKEDDTAQVAALEDADDTENVKLLAGGAHRKVGIDVSSWQKKIDWTKVASQEIEFTIIRAGYRGSKTGSLVEDSYFRENIRAAKECGLEVGVYFFTQATNEVEAVEEASAVLSLLGDVDLNLPIYIDTEGAGGKGRADGLDVQTRTLVCEAFCRTIKNAGRDAGIYASRNWLNKKLEMVSLEKYETWLAEYRGTPLYDGAYSMWQYTSKGSVDGIEGNVDLDVYYY